MQDTKDKFECSYLLFKQLCTHSLTIGTTEHCSFSTKEHSILYKLLVTTVNQAQTLLSIAETTFTTEKLLLLVNTYSAQEFLCRLYDCTRICTSLWSLLHLPSPKCFHTQIVNLICLWDRFINNILLPQSNSTSFTYMHSFLPPQHPSKPSITHFAINTQIIVNPYAQALTCNYYFPLSTLTMDITDWAQPENPFCACTWLECTCTNDVQTPFTYMYIVYLKSEWHTYLHRQVVLPSFFFAFAGWLL